MLESIVEILQGVPWYWVLCIAFLVTVAENIFPPAPCDSVLVFTGSLVGIGVVGFVPLLLFATLGSAAGFVLMYWLGLRFGTEILDSRRFKFLSRESMEQPERLFRKYGDIIIVINRFLSGTRAFISFFAGMSRLNTIKTVILASMSALFWNIILIYLGIFLGKNWRTAEEYISAYGQIVIPVIVIASGILIYRWIRKQKKIREKAKKKEKALVDTKKTDDI